MLGFQSEIDRQRERLCSTRGGFQAATGNRWNLTRLGQVLAVFTLLCLAAGFLWDRNAFMVVTAVMAPLLVLSVPLSRAVFRGLEARGNLPLRVVAGRPFRVRVDVRKTGGWLGAHSVRMAPGFLRGKHMILVHLSRGERQRISGLYMIPRRGVYVVEWIRITTLFPFGLVRRNAIIPLNREIIVHPAPVALRDRILAPDPARTLGDGFEMPKVGEDEFFGLRDHRPGDRMRNISWRSTARLGKLVVREMRQQAESELDVVLHGKGKPSRMLPVYVERAVEFTAGLLDQARCEKARMRLEVRGRHPGVVFVDSHPYTYLRAMDLLAGFGPGKPVRKKVRIHRRRRRTARRIHVILGVPSPEAGADSVVNVADPTFPRRIRRKERP